MAPFRVLIADNLPPEVLERYNQLEELEIRDRSGISVDELAREIGEYDALVVRSRTRVTADMLQKARRLQLIGRAGAGVDNIDIHEATKRGIIVMNTPGGNTIAATEHTIGMMIAALRNIPQAYQALKQHRWDRKSFTGRELYQKTVGIIGLGKIGREVARRLSAFECRLLGYDPLLTPELADRLGVRLVPLDTLLKESDIITLHTPKIPETINLLNKNTLRQCKPGVVIVNCARGGLVNESDLLEALESGQVACAAFDVFEEEPPENWALVDHPRFIGTPHLGASTQEAQQKVAEQILEQIAHFARTRVAKNAVNFLSVDENLLPLIRPYFELARRLGHVFSQIKSGRLSEVNIRFYGEILDLPVDPIAAYLMMGALQGSGEPGVEFINPVNAMTVARERGIEIEITKKDHPLTSHTNLIACDFITGQETIHLAGTVYARNIFRLVEYGDYIVDADLSGIMILIENEDVPGIIGQVGTILASENINISHLSSGRIKALKKAVNIFNVEGVVSPQIVQQLQKVRGIHRVRVVTQEDAG
ncbi:MAG: phosphoglycerate dehydrogenase [Calditrichaeota bacterium]|nr:phosphoglycerate dehydrogenase [Calditrichota bacterium]